MKEKKTKSREKESREKQLPCSVGVIPLSCVLSSFTNPWCLHRRSGNQHLLVVLLWEQHELLSHLADKLKLRLSQDL